MVRPSVSQHDALGDLPDRTGGAVRVQQGQQVLAQLGVQGVGTRAEQHAVLARQDGEGDDLRPRDRGRGQLAEHDQRR